MKKLTINIPISQEELEQLDKQAEAKGMTRAAYIRYMCLYQKEEN